MTYQPDDPSSRFIILPDNRTALMDLKTGEVYRSHTIAQAESLLNLLQALSAEEHPRSSSCGSNTFQTETVNSMSNQRKKLPMRRSPKGIAVFPALNNPDTKWKAEGVYKVNLALEGEDVDKMTAILEQVQEEARKEAESAAAKKRKKAKAVDLPVGPEMNKVGTDEDGDPIYEETGRTVFKFKSNASGTRKDGKQWARKLPLFDAKGKPTKDEVGGGSTLIVAYTGQPWVNPKFEYGVKLQIEAVQIIDLVQFGERNANSFGFGEEEGYEADETGYGFDSKEAEPEAAEAEEDDF